MLTFSWQKCLILYVQSISDNLEVTYKDEIPQKYQFTKKRQAHLLVS